MAHHPITDKNGKPTSYYWSDEHATNPEKVTVFRKTDAGEIKKMTGVHYDSKSGRMIKG